MPYTWGQEEHKAEQARSLAQQEEQRRLAEEAARNRMPETRYDRQLAAAHAAQLGMAEKMYGAAGEQGRLQAAQLRGAGLQQTLGGLGQGGLAARHAIVGTGQASWGAGQEGARIGSAERLAAADAYMRAQSQEARYAASGAEAWQQRFLAEQGGMMAADAAYRERKEREAAAERRVIGALLGGGGSMLASGGGG